MSDGRADLVIDAIGAEPWAITEEGLRQIIAIALRANDTDIAALEKRAGQKLDNARTVTVRDGVATIPVRGPLFRYANLFTEISGATSFETLAKDLETAVNDRAVRAVLLAIDSPGGQVNGTLAFAKQVLEARDVKPIGAHVSGVGASAAFWIASAASRGMLRAEASSMVGSIGAVIGVQVDKKPDEKSGVRNYEFVSAISPLKRADPSTTEGAAQFQRVVDALGMVFAESVAANMNIPVAKVLEKFGQGGMLVGQQAVGAGMIDQLSSYEELLSELAGRDRPASVFTGRASAITQEGKAVMAEPANPPAAPTRLTQAQLETEYSTEMKANAEKVAATAVDAALKAERERIAALDKLGTQKPKHADLIAKAKADPSQTAATVALAIAEAEAAALKEGAEKILGDEKALGKDKPAAAAPADPNSDSAVAQRILTTHAQLGGGRVASTSTRSNA